MRQTGYILRAGASIHYRVAGRGQPVLLLHGNGEDSHSLDNLIALLARRYRVIAMDSRGHGQSSFGQGRLRLRDIALDAAAVLEHLHIQKSAVVGFSDGANAALHLALSRPERVRALVLAGGNLTPGGVKRLYQFPFEVAYYALSFCLGHKARKKRQVLGLMVKEPRFRFCQLKAIQAPTLVLAGERDMIREDHTRAMAGAIPGAKLCIIPGASHFVFAPATLDRAAKPMLRFLRRGMA